MKKARLLSVLILTALFLLLVSGVVIAKPNSPVNPLDVAQQESDQKLVIYFFWGDGCPHCAEAKPIFESLAKNNPRIDLKMYEIYYVEENQELFAKFGERFGMTPKYIPTFFIGDRYWEGWSDQLQADVLTAVNNCLLSGCEDKAADLVENAGQLTIWDTTTEPVIEPTVAPEPTPDGTQSSGGKTVKLPIIGEIDLSHQSLFLSTLLIAFVDGFNPCSIWVLSMLLAITLHTGSRKKVLLIGLIFLTVTALIYALFIAGLFTVLTVVSFVGWIQVVVALVALFFSLVNIKDYFWYKEGVSFTISEDKKPGLFQRMRKVLEAGDSTWGLIGGTIVLAAGVSLVEFSCTAGFPVLWTNLLSSQNVPVLTFILLLLVYMIVYQLDELGIFIAAVVSLKSSKMEEKHGRILKLIGGVLMLTLAIVMLVKPSIMSDIGQSLIIFGIAFGVTGIILLLHRVVLPKLGIHIGTEYTGKKTKKKGKKI
jgi:thiol-disulfide isomerase/thioredoxin